MPIVFDSQTRGNNDNSDNNGHLQQQHHNQHSTDTTNSTALFEEKARRILTSGTLQQRQVKKTTISMTPQDKDQNYQNQQQHQTPLPLILSSGNDASSPFSSLPETTETETLQSATTATAKTTSSPCLMTAKLDTVVIPSDQSVQDEVSWAASQPDHRQRHHRLQHEQQQQQQQQQEEGGGRREAYSRFSVSTQHENLWQRGNHNVVENINNSDTGVQHQQQKEGEELQTERDDSSRLYATTESRRGLERGTSSFSSPSFSCPSPSCSPSPSPPPPSSLLPFSFPSLPSLADNNLVLRKQSFPSLSSLLPTFTSSSSFEPTRSPLSPPDSATSAISPLSVLSPSYPSSLTAAADLDSACVVDRGNVVLDTNNSGSSVVAASMASSENSIHCEEGELSHNDPMQSDSIVVSDFSPLQETTFQLSSSLTHQSLNSSGPSLFLAAAVSSSNERRGNDCAGPEQARTKRRRSMDDSDASDQEEVKEESDDVRVGSLSHSLPPSPFPSPIELDDSLSFSKGLVVKTEQPTAKEAMNLNSAKGDSQMTLITTGATTAAVETESLPGLERRRRRRKVTEGHDATTMTTTPGKTAKIAETPAAVPNNSIDQNEAEAHASTARPSCSYTTMIMEVFQASNKTRLDLPDIYGGVMAKYPYYRKANKVWQSSVRHALSQSKFFYKMERGPDEPGKGSLWVIDTRNTFTPNPPRKRKASTGGDYQSATACPVHSKDRHAVAPASKLVCTTTTVEPLEDERARGFHPSAASIPSPAASDDTDDINAVRRSGRARRPPRTKEADEYATTMAALPSHSRKPSLVMGTSLSTPPSSPMPQEHHHSETKMPASRVTSPPPSVARKRSSSIRSDKNLTGSGPFSSRTNPHFTIELPTYSPKKSSTSPRRTPSNLDLDLANIPGVVTSPRIRRPPQKLAEFVSSEDFKADPCGKRPALSSGSAFTSSFGANTDRTTTSSPVSSSTGSGSGVGEGAGMTERRVERRGRKRSRPDVVGCPSSSQQQQHTAGRRSNRKGMAVEDNAKSLIGLQGNTTLPVAMTTHCHAVVGGGAPAFISLKDLELSHAASLDNYDDEEDEHEEEEDYFGLHKRRNYRTSSSSRRYGSTGRQSQHETYEQRRQAGIQQIVVASLDWYEESDSEDDDVDVEVGVDVDGDSDLDMDNNNNNDNNSCNSSNVGVHGGTARSGFDSGFDSGSDSCKGFVRDGGWMMTETGNETTVGAAELARAGLEDIGGVTSVTDAFETVCMLAPEDEDQVVIDSAAAVGTVVDVDVATVPSHFMQPVEMPSGAGLMEQNGVHVHGSQAVSAAVDTSSLLLPVTIDTSSSLELVSLEAAAGVMPMIPGGILKELVAATTAVLEVSKSVAGSGVVAEPMEVEMEDEHSGDACVHIESMIAATVTTATATTTAELKADNYMGWLNL